MNDHHFYLTYLTLGYTSMAVLIVLELVLLRMQGKKLQQSIAEGD